MKWAEPTWFFFHCFAEKINPIFFLNNKKICLKIICEICDNLPCPMCKNHANLYIRNNNINNIRNKNDLIKYLYVFHNYVNIKTGKKKVDINILEKYKNGIFINISIYFLKNFKRGYSLDFINKMNRQNFREKLRKWLQNNYKHFS
tara:strand:+ start:1638 stop:2075 length:438 start_codon:yes stop_codon:yes gene_type:complete